MPDLGESVAAQGEGGEEAGPNHEEAGGVLEPDVVDLLISMETLGHAVRTAARQDATLKLQRKARQRIALYGSMSKSANAFTS